MLVSEVSVGLLYRHRAGLAKEGDLSDRLDKKVDDYARANQEPRHHGPVGGGIGVLERNHATKLIARITPVAALAAERPV